MVAPRTAAQLPAAAMRAARAAVSRAHACEGSTGLGPNAGAAWVHGDARPVSRSSTATAPAWDRLLETAVPPGAELAVSMWPEAPALARGLTRRVVQLQLAGLTVVESAAAGDAPGSLRAALRRAGVTLRWGVPALEARAAEAHRKYRASAALGRPFVTLKGACSLDGCVATGRGHSKWITGPAARKEGHRLRARHAAIAVGSGTVLADDPRLDVRLVRGRDPAPVIFDGRLRTVEAGRELALHRGGVTVLHRADAPPGRVARARGLGMETVRVRGTASGLSVPDALRKLFARGVGSLMVEGGGRLLASFIRAGLYDELWLFMAPRLLGGEGQPLLPGLDWRTVDAAPHLEVRRRRALGDDLLWICARGD